MGWTNVELNSALDENSRYRATFFLRLPDTLEWKNKVINVIKNADKFVHSLPSWLQFGYSRISIVNVETGNASSQNAVGKITPWPVRITFNVGKLPAGGGANWSTIAVGDEPNILPAALLAPEVLEALAWLIGIATVAFVIVSRSLEKLIAPIFNPGFAVLVIVGIFLIVGAKHGKVPVLT